MATTPAKEQAEPTAGKPAGKKPAGILLWAMVGVIAAASFALPTVLLCCVGVFPTFVALIVDRSRDGNTPMAVGTLNLAGLLPSLLGLWTGGHTVAIASRILSDPYTWLFAYGAAAVGWALVLGLPKVVETAMTFRNESEIRRLEARQQALVAEWGPDVAAKNKPAAE